MRVDYLLRSHDGRVSLICQLLNIRFIISSTVITSYLLSLVASPAGSDFPPRADIRLREQMSTHTMRFVRSLMPTVPNCIVRVFAASTPSEIGEIVVRRVIIEMKTEHPCGTRTYESLQDQVVDVASMLPFVSTESDHNVSATPSRTQFFRNNGVLPTI